VAGTAGTDRRIVELMEVETAERDLDWLKASLQSAVDLEFATLPVYLSGLCGRSRTRAARCSPSSTA
jgi:hypothetical protein